MAGGAAPTSRAALALQPQLQPQQSTLWAHLPIEPPLAPTNQPATHLEVLCHQPGLESAEQEAGGDAAQQAPPRQHPEAVEVLGEAAQGVNDAVGERSALAATAAMVGRVGGRGGAGGKVSVTSVGVQAQWNRQRAGGLEVVRSGCKSQQPQHPKAPAPASASTDEVPAPTCWHPHAPGPTSTSTRKRQHPQAAASHSLPVSQGTDDCAKHHTGAEASNEQLADVTTLKAVVLVQGVDVGALQPVAGCAGGKVGGSASFGRSGWRRRHCG